MSRLDAWEAHRIEGWRPESVRTDRTGMHEQVRRLGFRLTPQRQTILDIFHDLPEGTHLSAEELHDRLKIGASGIRQSCDEGGLVVDKPISLATTYRTLKLLASIGLLRELDFAEGHKHYEVGTPQQAPHHHLICVACSQAIEFTKDELYDMGVHVAGAYGFRMIDIQYKVYGVCPGCQESPPAGRTAP